ncbi:putative serine/threonine-protein kinase PBL7 [Silene latifolia]|uniref:putative serine/threonine-protein kinase PBL7 n=1 Tax=Silene latifolia TaxID=37657 RepID=UPI003D77618A
MEYLNIIDFCSSSTSIWLRITFVIMFLYCSVRLSKFIWGLRFKIVHQTSNSSKTRRRPNRKKNRARKKHIPDVSVAPDSHSQPKEDLNTEDDLCVEPLVKFPLQSLADATKKFDLDLRTSVDGLGSVFKGKLKNTEEVLIIRRLNEVSLLTPEEFEDEVSLLSQANHQNLTKLIGYSIKFYKRFLVYDYVSGGTLESHLYGNPKCLDWETRMKIVVGVAKALRYLHNEMKTPILHCYIHPSNIWLDENCNPKLSAYGVVRLYYPAKRNMVSSFMIGSYYYTIHDHRLTRKVTIEADIYGFGIFLLEIITGRKGCIIREDGVAEYLIDWVQPYLKDKQKLAEIVDSRLGGNFKEEELYEVCNIAEMCLKKQPSDRPPMADLVTRMSHLGE